MRAIETLFVSLALIFCAVLPVFSGDIEITFDDTEVGREPGEGDWTAYDEESLGDATPSTWGPMNSPLNGVAMSQNSNIWGDATDAVAIGSCVVYDMEEWSDFMLEVDVVANDNDGMGLVWRWEDINNHYRYITMIDSGNSPAGKRGPYRMIERRLGDVEGTELPFYETLAENDESYLQGTPQTWKLEAIGDTFKFYVDDELTLEATDSTYQSGKIGFLVYAQSGVFFDNLRITDLWAVDAQGKLAATWAGLKSQ